MGMQARTTQARWKSQQEIMKGGVSKKVTRTDRRTAPARGWYVHVPASLNRQHAWPRSPGGAGHLIDLNGFSIDADEDQHPKRQASSWGLKEGFTSAQLNSTQPNHGTDRP